MLFDIFHKLSWTNKVHIMFWSNKSKSSVVNLRLNALSITILSSVLLSSEKYSMAWNLSPNLLLYSLKRLPKALVSADLFEYKSLTFFLLLKHVQSLITMGNTDTTSNENQFLVCSWVIDKITSRRSNFQNIANFQIVMNIT